MQSQKVQVKIFSVGQSSVVGYAPVFQRWIREHVLDELLIDVVDYSHVADGPELALIGHESDYVLDRAEGKLGLLYSSKHVPESKDGSFQDAIRRAVNACLLLENENLTAAPLTFSSSELLLRIANRLAAPNTDATFERVAPALRGTLTRLYGNTPYTVERSGSPRELFSVKVQAPTAPPLRELLPRLGIAA